MGCDILATKDNENYVIQCKRYSEKVPAPVIGEILRARGNYGNIQKAIIITNNEFTSQAIKEAKNNNIDLWDKNTLKQILYEAHNFNLENLDYKTIEKETYTINLDPFLQDAIEYAVDLGQISASQIQRKFKVGYSRAGEILDQMENLEMISGYDGYNPSKVLITKEQINERLKLG